MTEVVVGRVTDFFAKPVVAGIELSGTLKIGDKIHIKGSTTDMELIIESLQIDRVDIAEAFCGDVFLFVEERGYSRIAHFHGAFSD